MENINHNDFIEYVEKQKRFSKGNVSIYHYTTLEAMCKILETKSLWATNCQYLNDIDDGKRLISILSDLANEVKNSEVALMINEIKDCLGNEEFKKFIDKIYFISFSEENDSVAMWGNYGKNGIVMEFDALHLPTNETNVLHKNSDYKKIEAARYIMDVIYNDDMAKNCFCEEINKILKKIDAHNSQQAQNNFDNEIDNLVYLFILCSLVKNKSYSYENEIRIAVALVDDKDIKEVEKYRIRNNLIIPYIDISFEKDGKLPLKSIRISPHQNDIMYKEGIERLLRSYGYNIDVYVSENKMRF